MTFFQVDDKFHANHKVMAMLDAEGFARASQAVALWTLVGSLARDSGLDGVVTLAQCTRVTADRNGSKRAALLLVDYGLWHAPGHACEKCPQPPAGSWIFHDWFQFGYATGAAERLKTAKSKELRTAEITEPVWARDTHTDGHPRCRYCEKKVTRPSKTKGGDRRSQNIGQLDHVDPNKAIGASNIVVSCADCNQHKAQRTPEQAAMTLLPAPGRPAPINPKINPPINTESITEVSPPRARPRVGAGGVGIGVRLGSSGVPAGLGDGGAGRAGAAPIVPVSAPWGSPWKDHHGPPPTEDVIRDATCLEHDQPMPCRDCLRGARS